MASITGHQSSITGHQSSLATNHHRMDVTLIDEDGARQRCICLFPSHLKDWRQHCLFINSFSLLKNNLTPNPNLHFKTLILASTALSLTKKLNFFEYLKKKKTLTMDMGFSFGCNENVLRFTAVMVVQPVNTLKTIHSYTFRR